MPGGARKYESATLEEGRSAHAERFAAASTTDPPQVVTQ
jgi:hypothetical protein